LVTATVTQSALACAVCFSAKNEASRFAFIITTVGLTVLPLLFIAWGVWWVVKRERAQEPLDDAARSKIALAEGSGPQGTSSSLASPVQSS
jgi:hypothetical protein